MKAANAWSKFTLAKGIELQLGGITYHHIIYIIYYSISEFLLQELSICNSRSH